MHRTRRLMTVLSLLVAAGGLLAAPVAALTRPVEIRDSEFPERLRIDRGDVVQWKNVDSDTHTVTADDGGFDSGSLRTDQTFAHAFESVGSFRYHCERHSDMTGVVEVAEAPTTTTTAPPTTTTAPPTTTTTAPPPPTTTPTTVPPTTVPPTTATTRPATTTTAPEQQTTSSTARTGAAVESPATDPSTTTSAPAATTTTAPATTTSVPSTSTTIPAATPTTATPPPMTGPPADPDTAAAPEAERSPEGGDSSSEAMAAERALSARRSTGLDAGTAVALAILLAAGAFGLWSLWKVRPGRA